MIETMTVNPRELRDPYDLRRTVASAAKEFGTNWGAAQTRANDCAMAAVALDAQGHMTYAARDKRLAQQFYDAVARYVRDGGYPTSGSEARNG